MLAEHFCVGIAMIAQALVNDWAKTLTCQYRAECAMKNLSSGFGKSGTRRDVVPTLKIRFF